MEEIGKKEKWIVLAQCSFVCSNMENSFGFICQWLYRRMQRRICCDMGQNDTIGKIELNPSFVLSSDNTNCKNDIQ